MLNFAKFCETKEDFNLVYGLPLEGIDPAMIIYKLVSYIDWLSVYKVPRVKGKMNLKHVRPELYYDWMRLQQKVHQEISVNNESLVAFARAFAYKYCKTREATNPEMYRRRENDAGRWGTCNKR